jgi:hypothetical protein
MVNCRNEFSDQLRCRYPKSLADQEGKIAAEPLGSDHGSWSLSLFQDAWKVDAFSCEDFRETRDSHQQVKSSEMNPPGEEMSLNCRYPGSKPQSLSSNFSSLSEMTVPEIHCFAREESVVVGLDRHSLIGMESFRETHAMITDKRFKATLRSDTSVNFSRIQ